MEKRYLGIKEVSSYTGIAVGTLYNWSSERKITCAKVGSRLLFDKKDVDAFMEKRKKKPYKDFL